MSGAQEEPPGTMEGGPPESVIGVKETCEHNKSQLETFKEIMLRNQQSIKKKEEEVSEYAKKLSKIKSRAKFSRRSKDAGTSLAEPVPKIKTDTLSEAAEDVVDDISQAKTPKAKSSLLQKKLAENRKIFEQRNKEITETKRAVEEKVEAIRQQLEERDLAIVESQREDLNVTPVRPVLVTPQMVSPVSQVAHDQEKDNKITELSNKVLELELIIVDLQENLKEKDSVIESKTKAVTLMSADLSKKGKTTLDTLEDTKDEMRLMQENFVLLETTLKNKNDHLLEQLQERDGKISDLEEVVKGMEQQLEEHKAQESTHADQSRIATDTLADTKSAMKSMQENFVLVESSLKAKNENLLQQLEEREMRLLKASERISSLEAGAGIVTHPEINDLLYKIERLEQSNHQLQDEKYELQKSIAEIQNRIVSVEPIHVNGLIAEKDNRIAELENLVEELKSSNQLLEEESKTELQKQVAELSSKNEEFSNKVIDLEKLVHDLEVEKNELSLKVPVEGSPTKEDEKISKLTKELEDLNKNMIKVKAQHKSKVKNLQKQLENFKMVSDTNAELVKLGNQVALLEEEKGNLQLSLVDFDELKASAGDWQERISELDSKVSAQANEIQMHVDAIATLENQKLDLLQELHTVKQEISQLEAENAESENLRVTAEMKVVDLEEQLENLTKKANKQSDTDSDRGELLKKIEELTQENHEYLNRLSKQEEKSASGAESTGSFEALQDADRTELLRKIESLTLENNDMIIKLTKYEEKSESNGGSTESFETINDTDKLELLKKIDSLTRENSDLLVKLGKAEEKGSSDTGSTESFERIPDQESTSKIELLSRENQDLVIKLTKLEEKLQNLESKPEVSDSAINIKSLIRENQDLTREVAALKLKLVESTENLQNRIDILTQENVDLAIDRTKFEERALQSKELETVRSKKSVETEDSDREDEVRDEINRLKQENNEMVIKLTKLDEKNQDLKDLVQSLTAEKEELLSKANESLSENLLEPKENVTVASLEREIEDSRKLIAEQKSLVEEMNVKLTEKERELESKVQKINEYEAASLDVEALQKELRESSSAIEEWKFKVNDMQEKMRILEEGKASIEEGLKVLEEENKQLTMQSEQKDAIVKEMERTIAVLETKVEEELRSASTKEEELVVVKRELENKEKELHDKYAQLQNELIAVDTLQDQLNDCKLRLQQKDVIIQSLSEEVERMNALSNDKDEEIFGLQGDLRQLREQLEHTRAESEFDALLEELRDNKMVVQDLQGKLEMQSRENADLSARIEKSKRELQSMQSQLSQKESEAVELLELKEHLENKLGEVEKLKAEAERRVHDYQSTLDNNEKYMIDLQGELSNTYRLMEQLKAKHTEDIRMQNNRVEDVLDDLHSKSLEIENLKSELEEKERLVGLNLTEQVKHALEAKISQLEQQLLESEDKNAAQLEKMKKIAANLKKKTSQCQQLESNVSDLERQLSMEKNEKELVNKQIRDLDDRLQERDNRIGELEERLTQARSETNAVLESRERLMTDVETSNAKMTSLLEQITEMGEEITRLRDELRAARSEIDDKENLLKEYEAYKQQVAEERGKQQIDLFEAKDNARELSVRMQVMESEYLEQLTLIKMLKTENGLLSAKQTQINEKLETVEKESEERRILIGQLQKRYPEKTESVQVQTLADAPQHCEYCNQCQALVQTLEAKLQERDAEIENLDNELANSIGTTRVQEALRQNQEDPELLSQYNALKATNEELKGKLETMGRENQELTEKIESLQALNTTLEERIHAVGEELTRERETTAKLQNVDELYAELLRQQAQREAELEEAREQLFNVTENSKALEEEIRSLSEAKRNFEREIASLKDEVNVKQDRLMQLESETDGFKERSMKSMTEADSASRKDEAPQLFDASKIFGLEPTSESDDQKEMSRIRNNLAEKESECLHLTSEVSRLQRLLEERSNEAENYSRCVEELRNARDNCQTLGTEILALREELRQKNAQVDALNAEVSDLSAQTEAKHSGESEKDKTNFMIQENNQQIAQLNAQLDAALMENERLNETVREIVWLLDREEPSEGALSARLTNILGKLSALRNENNDLLATQEAYKQKVADLESEIRNSTDNARIQELEGLIDVTTRERDLLQLQLNDLTRALEESKESTASSDRTLEIEKALRERDEALRQTSNLTALVEDLQKSLSKRSIEDTGTIAAEEHTEEPPAWDANEKLDIEEEEGWGWNAEEAKLAEEHHPVSVPILPSVEIQLQMRISELEDRVRDLESENAKISEESKAVQVRSGKLIKKLKELKIQNDNYKQQMKIQKSAGGFCELDSAIEEELKLQVSNLEKMLNETKEEHKKTLSEKENLVKRIDVLVAANERFVEMKERQDMDLEVWEIRNKELNNKIQSLERQIQDISSGEAPQPERVGDDVPVAVSQTPLTAARLDASTSLEELCKRYSAEIDDLKEEMEALGNENEQLQHLLEEQRSKRIELESKIAADTSESLDKADDVSKKCNELQKSYDSLKEEYELLRHQYEQTLTDSSNQLVSLQQNNELLQTELAGKSALQETVQKDLDQSKSDLDALQKQFHEVSRERETLLARNDELKSTEEKLSSLMVSLAEVTELLNSRVQEVADLKKELQQQYIDRTESENKFQDTVEKLSEEVNEKVQEIIALKRILSDKENECSEQRNLETASAIVGKATEELMQRHAVELEDKQREITLLSEKLSNAEHQLQGHLNDLKSSAAQIEDLGRELTSTRDALRESNAIVESCKSEVAMKQEKIRESESQIRKDEGDLETCSLEVEKHLLEIRSLEDRNNALNELVSTLQSRLSELAAVEEEFRSTRAALMEKESLIGNYEEQIRKCQCELESRKMEDEELRGKLRDCEQEIAILRNDLQNATAISDELRSLLESASKERDNLNKALLEKESTQHQWKSVPETTAEGLPIFTMEDHSPVDLQTTINSLKAELEDKRQQIEHMERILNENPYPAVIQKMQDDINTLYGENARKQATIENLNTELNTRDIQIESLIREMNVQRQDLFNKEEIKLVSRERRSVQDEGEIGRLQNELHEKEQEINDLKYVISQKDSQLSFQANESPSEELELRDTVEKLNKELFARQREVEELRLTISEMQWEISRLKKYELLSMETNDAIEKLSSEKEGIRVEAAELLRSKLEEKESEIDELKQRLAAETKQLLETFNLREADIENLRREVEDWKERSRIKENELSRVNEDLLEKDRRLAELSITKDAEIHNLRVQIHDREARIEELAALSEEEARQLGELRGTLEIKEREIQELLQRLDDRVQEYNLIQQSFKRQLTPSELTEAQSSSEGAAAAAASLPSPEKDISSNELDLALYMLHQRDVRCEELTHELMQLLEERDTLQLRLSNAIRINEELRKVAYSEGSPKKNLSSSSSGDEPVIEEPSPSRSEGPVEIAKEAIDSPIGEDKQVLAQKLSELHTVGHRRDVRLRDEQELRHAQQMSLLAHKDVLSNLPPEAAARLVNANYTLYPGGETVSDTSTLFLEENEIPEKRTRDVQSQSSVLLNWLWGKSTPKVVHM